MLLFAANPAVPSGPLGVRMTPALEKTIAFSSLLLLLPDKTVVSDFELLLAVSPLSDSSPVEPKILSLACAYSSSRCLRLLGCGRC